MPKIFLKHKNLTGKEFVSISNDEKEIFILDGLLSVNEFLQTFQFLQLH